MADSKITALDNLTSADPANDMIPIVDVSATPPASGNTKRISINNLLACSPSATLASATITGDLTVDTSTLKVDSTNNRVGVVQATPLYPLHLVGEFGLEEASPAGTGSKLRFIGDATKYNFRIGKQLNVSNGFEITPSTTVGGTTFSNPVYTVTNDGIHTFLDGAGGTRMTLNSTGLGIGVASPSTRLHIQNTGDVYARIATTSVSKAGVQFSANGVVRSHLLYDDGAGTTYLTSGTVFGGSGQALAIQSGTSLAIYTNNQLATAQMTLDSTGNVGIGVQPSAWVSYQKSIDFGGAGNYGSVSARTNFAAFATNCYFDGTNWVYKNNNPANTYEHSAGSHIWRYAAAGTGNITFTQAMTLDASSNLYVGTTSSYLASRLNLQVTSGQPDAIYIRNSSASLSLYWRLGNVDTNNRFNIYNQSSVGVYLTDGATSWTGTSDERLKDIIEPISNAVAKVGSLRSVIGKFKKDSEGTRRSFLIAQDVQSVLPEAVDASNADELGIRYTEVIPLLVAAIKELTARVQTLETR